MRTARARLRRPPNWWQLLRHDDCHWLGPRRDRVNGVFILWRVPSLFVASVGRGLGDNWRLNVVVALLCHATARTQLQLSSSKAIN